MFTPGNPSEFVDGFHGTCGETALACALAAGYGATVPANDAAVNSIVYITRNLQARGTASANGATPMSALADYCLGGGVALVKYAYHPYQGDNAMGENYWHNLLLTFAGVRPIVLQLANGQALVDLKSQKSDERGLHYHFISIVGKEPAGYNCTDGDSPIAGTGQYDLYSIDTLRLAHPCAIMVLDLHP